MVVNKLQQKGRGKLIAHLKCLLLINFRTQNVNISARPIYLFFSAYSTTLFLNELGRSELDDEFLNDFLPLYFVLFLANFPLPRLS